MHRVPMFNHLGMLMNTIMEFVCISDNVTYMRSTSFSEADTDFQNSTLFSFMGEKHVVV